jgi:hypothetical protein
MQHPIKQLFSFMRGPIFNYFACFDHYFACWVCVIWRMHGREGILNTSKTQKYFSCQKL